MPLSEKSASTIREDEHQEAEWVLVRAIPNLVTGEAINIGILAKREGQWEMLVGNYKSRLRALGTPPANQRVIDEEIKELRDSIERGARAECKHLHQTSLTLMVRPGDRRWPEALLEEMMPDHDH